MKRKRHSAEQIISKLREAEVLLQKGQAVPQVCRQLGVTAQTYYRWRIDYNADRPHSSLGNLAPIEFERRSQKNRITEPKILNL